MKRRQWTWVLWALVAAQLVLIFVMSAQEAPASRAMSLTVSRVVARAVTPDFDRMAAAAQAHAVERVHHAVRKGAHLLEYAMLGMFLTLALHGTGRRRAALAAVLLSAIWAAFDELRQLTVSGRAGLISDVWIDIAGAALGALAARLLLAVRRALRARR